MTPEIHRALVQRLAYVVRLAMSHDEDSHALGPPLEALREILSGGRPRVITVEDDDVQVDGRRVAFEDDLEGAEYASMIGELFEALGIARLVFTEAVDAEELAELVRAIRRDYRSAVPEAFAARRFTRILVESRASLRIRTRLTLGAWLALREELRRLQSAIGRPDEARHVDAVLRRLLALWSGEPALRPLRIALAMRPSRDPVDHAASAAGFAMLTGLAAEALPEALSRVAVAGFLHALVGDHDARSRGSALAAAMRYGVGDARARGASLLPCTEPLPDAASAIVSASCAFHRLLAEMPADLAFQRLANEGDERLRLAARLLAHTLGTYPPGSAVRLSHGETGVVVRPSRDAATPDRSVVRVLREGGETPVDYLADLSERDAPRRITASVQSGGAGFDPLREFLHVWGSRP